MDTLVILLLLIAIALGGWLWLRGRSGKRESPDRRSAASSDTRSTKYHAVSIRVGLESCKAARDLEGRRFLATAAPRLPLAECDILECNCRFAHHDDRRSGHDRRSPFGASGIAAGTGAYRQERRAGSDRRGDEFD